MTDQNRNEMLFDALLEVAVSEAFKKEMDAFPSEKELNKAYNPSPELDKRIRKLIDQNYRRLIIRRLVKSAGKVAACIAIIFTVLSVILLSVGASRNAILNAVVEWTEKYTKIQFQDTAADAEYHLAYLPEGFSLTATESFGSTVMLKYANKAGIEIIFKQRLAERSTSLFDNENSDYIEIDISSNPAYLFEALADDDYNVLIWQSKGVVFELTSALDSTELIRIGESVKK